jgi:transposase-like protein
VVWDRWYVDETYVRIQGQWRYLNRAIDQGGNLVDVRLSNARDLAAVEAFFRSAWMVTGVILDRLITDGHDAYLRAIRTVLGDRLIHRMNRYLNNHLEQDHQGIKQRYRVTGGAKRSRQLRASVASLLRSARFSASSLTTTRPSRWRNAGASIKSDSPP